MIASAVAQALPLGVSGLAPGILGWLAAALLAVDLTRRMRIQAFILIVLGFAGLAWSATEGVSPNWTRLVSGNSGLIALLSAVTFLRLLARRTPGNRTANLGREFGPASPAKPSAPAPIGRRALLSTFASVQFLGAIINLSALFIMGDGMSARGRPERRQIIVLSRGFAGAATWSPFFAAMAAALTFAPGARAGDLVVAGLAISALGLLITAREFPADSTRPFVGYPLHASSLAIPAALAVAVLALSFTVPSVSVLAWVSLLAPLVAIVVALSQGEGWRPIRVHIVDGLPKGGSELVLFLSAGVLAEGLATVVESLPSWLPFESFGGIQAVVTFASLLTLSIVGIHPVIGIAALGTVLSSLDPDPTLLAMTFLYAWSLGALVNPLSGLTLAVQGRYGVDGLTQLRWHIGYVLKLGLASVLALQLYAEL